MSTRGAADLQTETVPSDGNDMMELIVMSCRSLQSFVRLRDKRLQLKQAFSNGTAISVKRAQKLSLQI